MVYPTPGFVVRQTFLEFVDPNQDAASGTQPTACRRSHSDTTLYRTSRQPELFGSDELRLYCEARMQGRRSESARSESPQIGEPPDGQPATPSAHKSVPEEERTTVMLEHLPSEYTRVLLAETLEREGFAGAFDVVFVPMDLRTRSCNGHALVNLRSNAEARRALAHFEGFEKWQVPGTEACAASWSRWVQGTSDLLERYRNSPVMHHAVPAIYKPALFGRNGEVLEFPKPTKRLRMPRLRGNGKAAKEGHADDPAADRGRSPSAKGGAPATAAWFVDLVVSHIKTEAAPAAACEAGAPGRALDDGGHHAPQRPRQRQPQRRQRPPATVPESAAARPPAQRGGGGPSTLHDWRGAPAACQQDYMPVVAPVFPPGHLYVLTAC